MLSSRTIAVDLIDRREPGVPDRLRVIAAEVLYQLGKVEVGDAGDVRGRAAVSTPPQRLALDQRRPSSRAFEQVRGGQPGDAGRRPRRHRP